MYVIPFRKLRRTLPAKILICLCFSLLCLLVLFVSLVEETEPRLGCQIVASFLQYFMLSTFCWMFVEAVNLYRMFIKVFSTGSTGKFFIRANIFAWGKNFVKFLIYSDAFCSIFYNHFFDCYFCFIFRTSFGNCYCYCSSKS